MNRQFIRYTTILGLFLILAVVSVEAQTPSKVEVNVPFDFSAGSANLKAGAYSVRRAGANGLLIRSADGKTAALVNAPLTIGSRDSKSGERLVFNRYGEQYFLSQVWLTVDTGRQLFTSNSEAKTAREYRLGKGVVKPQRVEIAARAR